MKKKNVNNYICTVISYLLFLTVDWCKIKSLKVQQTTAMAKITLLFISY